MSRYSLSLPFPFSFFSSPCAAFVVLTFSGWIFRIYFNAFIFGSICHVILATYVCVYASVCVRVLAFVLGVLRAHTPNLWIIYRYENSTTKRAEGTEIATADSKVCHRVWQLFKLLSEKVTVARKTGWTHRNWDKMYKLKFTLECSRSDAYWPSHLYPVNIEKYERRSILHLCKCT